MRSFSIAEIDAVVESLTAAGDSKLNATTLELIAFLRKELEFHRRGKGLKWEKEFDELARARGLLVEPRTNTKHDTIVNGMRVQCKDAASGGLCRTPIKGREYHGYYREDWDVLAFRHTGVLLIIPVGLLLLDDGRCVLNNISLAAWRSWENRWDVFGDFRVNPQARQKSLFD